MTDSRTILALNSGSSSLKFAVYQFEVKGQFEVRSEAPAETLLASGEAQQIGKAGGRLHIELPHGQPLDTASRFADAGAAAAEIFSQLKRYGLPQPSAVGHRIVTGGSEYSEPQRITAEVVNKLRGLGYLAPVHLPAEIELIAAISAQWPKIPQVACFDTAFHSRMPQLAQRFPLPRALWDEGLRRYGFHGLSYEYVLQELGAAAANRRVILAHLGNGSSLAAVRDGRPLETTMGFTPTGGVMMGTRSGDLDPGVLLYLLREKHYDAARLEDLVDHQSGLLGVSGITADMKILLERRAGDPQAGEAVELFCYLIRKQIGALAAVLGGVDSLIFTGGIGEHAAPVREMICQGLEHLGIRLDSESNKAHREVIGAAAAGCVVRVVATNEELMIARHTNRLLSGSTGPAKKPSTA